MWRQQHTLKETCILLVLLNGSSSTCPGGSDASNYTAKDAQRYYRTYLQYTLKCLLRKKDILWLSNYFFLSCKVIPLIQLWLIKHFHPHLIIPTQAIAVIWLRINIHKGKIKSVEEFQADISTVVPENEMNFTLINYSHIY